MKRPSRGARFRNTIANLDSKTLDEITFRDTDVLNLFMSGQRKILPRRKTGVSARHQRLIARAIKRARQLGILGYRGQQR